MPGGLLRLSVGLEHPVDLWADLDDALSSASQSLHESKRFTTPGGSVVNLSGQAELARLRQAPGLEAATGVYLDRSATW